MKIVQLNVRSFWRIREPIYAYLEHERPDIILLNSTGITNNKKIKLLGYTSRQTADGAHRGSCILVNHTLKHEFLTGIFTHHSFLAVKIHTHREPIIIATTYAPPHSNLPLHDFNLLFDRNNIPVFFAGDVNASHTQLYHNNTNNHGRKLMALFNRKNLHYIGPDFYTFVTARGKGRPDLVFANRAALPYHTHCTPGPQVGSDHIPLVMTISANPIQNPEQLHYCYAQANWDEFKLGLQQLNLDLRCEVQGVSTQTLDDYWKLILDSMSDQMLHNIPQKTHKIRASFRPSMRTRRLEICYRTRFEQNQHRLGQVQWDLTILKNHLLNSYARDRAEYWAGLVHKTEEYRTTLPWDFWKTIRKLKGTSKNPFDGILDDGVIVKDPVRVIEIAKTYWEGVFRPHETHPTALDHVNFIENWLLQHRLELSPLPTVDLSTLSLDSPLTSPISLAEVKSKISHLRRKAPGESQIGRDAIQHLPNNVILTVTNLFNASLAIGYMPLPLKKAMVILIPKPDKDLKYISNFRPISLLETLGRIFESIVNDRLLDHLEDNSLLTSKQFGFRHHRSTQDALNIMTNYTIDNAERTLKTFLVTKDVEKAFDTVWHAGLKYKFYNNFNLPLLTVKFMCSFLDDRELFIKFQGQISEPIEPLAGLLQGSPLSPTSYSMYTSDMPDPIHPESLTLLYADDTTHLTRSYSVETAVERMNQELAQVAEWENQWRIKTNPEKTIALAIKPNCCDVDIPQIFLNVNEPHPRQALPIRHTAKVLGLTFDRHLRFHKQTANKQLMARLALNSVYRFKDASIATKRHLYQALVKPHLTYAPLALTQAKPTNRKHLQVIQNKALRWIHGVKWDDFVSNQDLHEVTRNTPPLNILWARFIHRQITRLQTWCQEWFDKSTELARTGPRRWAGATNFMEFDFLTVPEPSF